MAEYKISLDKIQECLIAAVDALRAGDYQTRYIELVAAQTLMFGVPRMALLKSEIELNPENLDAMVQQARRDARNQSQSGGIVSRPTEMIRTRGDC